MTLPTPNKQLIEKLKTAVIFAAVIFAAGFYVGNQLAHKADAQSQRAIDTAVHATLSKG